MCLFAAVALVSMVPVGKRWLMIKLYDILEDTFLKTLLLNSGSKVLQTPNLQPHLCSESHSWVISQLHQAHSFFKTWQKCSYGC